ncbi:MAG: hypothetical protein BWY23_02471 [Spirochaetes bacterium ADurb.Bin218]|nr:MAG: hypothetical protein BWY23_02471 [Spirochaetes bacterium ADurb.Bin218]
MEKQEKLNKIENINNTTAVANIIQGDDDEITAHVATLLGPKFNLPKAGVIRPGIMKLKGGATPQDKALYEKMLAEGATWDEIDQELGTDANGKSKLIPANVDYFTVRPRDCQNPKMAEEIYKLYADKDGKLRSFPVWFPVNEWWNIIPHSLRCFSQSGIKFRSAFREKGRRVCEFPLEIEPGRKVFNGRPWGERPCEPDTCREYQTGECKLGGVLQFYIPGIKGIGLWVLPTTSWYSLVRIKSSLEAVSSITGGRLSRIFIDGQTPFVLKKVLDEVSRVDPKTGKSIRQSQWLINLDVQIDMFELVKYGQEKTIEKRGLAAISILNGTHSNVNPIKDTVNPVTDVEPEPNPEPEPNLEPEPEILASYANEATKIFTKEISSDETSEDVFVPEEPEIPDNNHVEEPIMATVKPDNPVKEIVGTIKAVSGTGKGIKVGETWYNITEKTKKNVVPEKGMAVKITYVQGSRGLLLVNAINAA